MTARLIFAALFGSLWFQISAATVAGLGALKLYTWHQQNVGATKERAAIKKETENETALAGSARIRAQELSQERAADLWKRFGIDITADPPPEPMATPASGPDAKRVRRVERSPGLYERTTAGK